MDAWISAAVSTLYFAAVVLAVVTVLIRKKETASALGWSLAIVFLPFIGLGLFLFLRLSRK